MIFMKVTTEERIYLIVYLGIASFLILQGDTLIGGIVAIFGFLMAIFTRLRQITRILKKNNLWVEEQLDKNLDLRKDVKEAKKMIDIEVAKLLKRKIMSFNCEVCNKTFYDYLIMTFHKIITHEVNK